MTKVNYIERFQPDYSSIRLWLMNRRPEEWREKHDIDLKGAVTVNFDKEDEEL